MRQPYLIVARLRRPHGLQGEVYADLLTDDADRFFQGLRVFLFRKARPAGEAPLGELTVEKARAGTSGLLLFFREWTRKEDAAHGNGLYLAVRREDALPLRGDQEFYAGDLLGASVHDEVRGALGIIDSVDAVGPLTVVSVKKEGEEDLAIPLRKAYIRRVDLDRDRIDVSLPDDLYDLYRGSGAKPGGASGPEAAERRDQGVADEGAAPDTTR